MTPPFLNDDQDRPPMDAALAAVWAKARTGVLERVAVIESAAEALRAGPLDAQAREDAESAAHKLAGVAGTFGFWDATDLAREAEAAFGGSDPLSPDLVERIGEIAAALRIQLSA